MQILIFTAATFAGFVVGRISHAIAHGRHIQAIHHWIWGVIISIFGLFLLSDYLRIITVGFGMGLVISDLNDMLKLRIYGVVKFEKQKFWDIK